MEEILLDAYMRQIEKQELELQNQSITHAPTLSRKYRVKDRLGLYIVVNLGPRCSKGKVIKIERN